MHIDQEIQATREKLGKLLARKEKLTANKVIKCADCQHSHRIKDIELIDVLDYESPHGCTGGDYHYHGEYNFMCSNCGICNRFLFNTRYSMSYQHRDKLDLENMFFSGHRDLFKSVSDIERKKVSGNFVNNYYIEKNLKKFFTEKQVKEIDRILRKDDEKV